MAFVLRKLYYAYLYLDETKDKRLMHLPMTSVPAVLCIGIGYYCLIKYGCKSMVYRNEYQLKGIMMIYNILQVIFNAGLLLTYACPLFLCRKDYELECQGLDFTSNGIGVQEAYAAYFYYILKLFDLFDTMFFILRKKFSHLSFLHIYHHMGVLLAAFVSLNFAPGGHSLILGFLNCIVHTLMYSYYFLTIYSENVKKMVWLKKCLTQTQMLQFSLLVVHYCRGLFFGTCNYPKVFLFLAAIQNMFMLILFSDFYFRTYNNNGKHKEI